MGSLNAKQVTMAWAAGNTSWQRGFMALEPYLLQDLQDLLDMGVIIEDVLTNSREYSDVRAGCANAKFAAKPVWIRLVATKTVATLVAYVHQGKVFHEVVRSRDDYSKVLARFSDPLTVLVEGK